MNCIICGRQLTNKKPWSNQQTKGPFTSMIGGNCCANCSIDLDENGLFPEERTLPKSYSLNDTASRLSDDKKTILRRRLEDFMRKNMNGPLFTAALILAITTNSIKWKDLLEDSNV